EEKRTRYHGDVVDQRMMVEPDDPDREETDQVADEYGPTVAQLLQQGPVAWPFDAEIERQQGDGHSKDAVTKRFEPSPGHLIKGGPRLAESGAGRVRPTAASCRHGSCAHETSVGRAGCYP